MKEFLYMEYCKGQPSKEILLRFKNDEKFRKRALLNYLSKHPRDFILSEDRYLAEDSVEECSSSQEASNPSQGRNSSNLSYKHVLQFNKSFNSESEYGGEQNLFDKKQK